MLQSSQAVLAAAASAAFVWFLDPPWAVVAVRLGQTRRPTMPWWLVVTAGFCGWIFLAALWGAPKALLSLASIGVAFGIAVRWKKSRHKARTRAAREACMEVVEVLASDLRAGVLPTTTLARLADEFDYVRDVYEAHRVGADVATEWHRASTQPGCESLRWVASAWAVAHESGAPLALVLETVAADIERELELVSEIESAVAPARSTAVLMAVLPLFALGMGSGMGAAPVHVITETLWGALAVSIGSILASLGVVWVDKIADHAERA